MKAGWRSALCLVALAGAAAGPAPAGADPAGTPRGAVTAAEAKASIRGGDLRGASDVLAALREGRLRATDPEKAEILGEIYRAARGSGGDAERFTGGLPPVHTRLQIGAMEEMARLPVAAARAPLSGIVESFLADFEPLPEDRRRLSPLQAQQMPIGRMLSGKVMDDSALAPLVSRFTGSAAVEEYAKWELAVDALQRRVSRIPAGTSSRPAEAAVLVLASFGGVDLQQARQDGRRVEACARIVLDAIGGRVDLLLAPLLDATGNATAAQRYFLARVVVGALQRKLDAGGAADPADLRRLGDVMDLVEETRAGLGEGRYGAIPLEKAVAALAGAIPDPALKKRMSEAVQNRTQ